MKKTIILSENAFNKIKRLMVQEAIKSNPYAFGPGGKDDYTRKLPSLDKVANLKVDRYKDHDLENSYKLWAETGFDKSSYEYIEWGNKLKSYLSFLAGGIEFVLNDKVRRINMNRPQWVFLDPSWLEDVVIRNQENEKHQSIYCLILKLSQNKVVWNDLFFNPIFEDLKNQISEIRQFVGKAIGVNPNLKLLLPLEQYRELTKFINDPSNAKPELFYEPQQQNFSDDEEDF